MTIQRYLEAFSKLTRAPGRMWGELTRNRAPHKPLLLLSVMDLIARGVITSHFISISGELVELNELFTDYWRSIIPVTRTSSVAFPFSRLHREPFWKLLPLQNREITGPIVDSITSVSQLRNVALGAEIDEQLFAHMRDAEDRKALGETLLRSCFSEVGQHALRERRGIHGEAFQYSRVIGRRRIHKRQLRQYSRKHTRQLPETKVFAEPSCCTTIIDVSSAVRAS